MRDPTLRPGARALWCMVFATGLLAAAPAAAQRRDEPVAANQDQGPDPAPVPVEAGRVASSSVGEVGRRQSRDEVAPGVVPAARIAGRIQNRVQSRLRNRIDRTYDPRADAVSPFAAAEQETRTAGGHR